MKSLEGVFPFPVALQLPLLAVPVTFLPTPFLLSPFPGDKALDGYSKKKYVCKLLFIFLLGHDIDFGHMEAVNLLSSNKYTEKQIVSGVQRCRLETFFKKIMGLASSLP